MLSLIRTAALGALAALGFSVGAARAADLEEIAAFALDICDAVNATGIVISSADHCMKFSGEFIYEKHFEWFGGNLVSYGYTALELLIEVDHPFLASYGESRAKNLAGVPIVDTQHRRSTANLDACLPKGETARVDALGAIAHQKEAV